MGSKCAAFCRSFSEQFGNSGGCQGISGIDFGVYRRRRGTKLDENDVFVEDIISEMFRSRRGGGRASGGTRGVDASFTLEVPFLEAVLGAKKRVTLAEGKTLDVTIPPGIESG